MAKFPSLQTVLKATLKTVLKFPLETITSVFGTLCAILLLQKAYEDSSQEFLIKAIMSCSLCLVLFLSISLFFFAYKKNSLYRYLTSLVLGSLAVAFVFCFEEDTADVEMQQYFVLNIALHLLVSFAGFLPKKYNQDEFWEFNKQLFLRILTSGLYSIVLYSGLALAILAVKELFKIEFDQEIYGYLFFIISGIFNTIFFLNGIPDTNNIEAPLKLSYPNGLKNFTQYVLLPLICLYLVILICYETKILIMFSLPVGWVSYLVLVFAIAGILSFLLIYPIATETKNLWMRTFNRWFYFLLIPLLGLLFWAILYRIFIYGFTHERYYVLLLSIWLTIVVGYFLLQKHPKIKFIPISLCIAGLLSIVGPQSADSISQKSQLYRFETYIKKIEKETLSFEQHQDFSSIVDFLEQNYSVEILIPYTKDKLTALLKKDKDPSSSEITEALGVVYRSRYDNEKYTNTNFNYYYYENNNQNVENIHGYDFSFSVSNNTTLECKNCTAINQTKYSIKSMKTPYGFDLQINQDKISVKISDYVNKTKGFDNNNNSENKITQLIELPKYRLLITYLSVDGTIKENKKIINNYNLKVMVGVK